MRMILSRSSEHFGASIASLDIFSLHRTRGENYLLYVLETLDDYRTNEAFTNKPKRLAPPEVELKVVLGQKIHAPTQSFVDHQTPLMGC